jgi:hypothetical protein
LRLGAQPTLQPSVVGKLLGAPSSRLRGAHSSLHFVVFRGGLVGQAPEFGAARGDHGVSGISVPVSTVVVVGDLPRLPCSFASILQ